MEGAISPGRSSDTGGRRQVTAGGSVPTGMEVVDLASATVLPGFIDVHTHLLLQSDHHPRARLHHAVPVPQQLPQIVLVG